MQTEARNTKLLGCYMTPDLWAAIDNWRRNQPDIPTRPEAVRRLLAEALEYVEGESDGE
jgi:hypothetical protein